MFKHLGHLRKEPAFFLFSLVLISFAYFLFEYFFIPYSSLSADEFVFARHIYEYTFHLPYRDFPPYKTVLGYYLLSVPMYFSQGIFATLINIKAEIVFLNLIFIGIVSRIARRLFNFKAVLLTWLLVLSNQLFLIYSADLRVDMLTGWLCLLSILYVMQNRVILGGIFISIAFLVSQKAIWYLIALDGAMFFCWLSMTTSSYTLYRIFIFNMAALLPLVIYILFWSFVSSPSTVFYNLFYEAYIQAKINLYADIYLRCWGIVLSHGPLLFFLWPLTTLMLFEKPKQISKQLFVIACAFISLMLFILYKQPFPYNFVFTVPAFFILYAQFIDWLLNPSLYFHSNKKLWPLIVFYIFLMAILIYLSAISAIYYGIILLTITILSYLYCVKHHKSWQTLLLNLIFAFFIILGVISPLFKSFQIAKLIDGSYQKTMLRLAAKILQEGDYVSGIPYFYQKDQPIAGMKNLIEPALLYLYRPSKQMETLLLPSLYLDVSNTRQIAADFEKTPVKLIINNYRIRLLPIHLRDYIEQHYQHFYGSLYIYAPVIEKGTRTFDLKFDGMYEVVPELNADCKAMLLLDDRIVGMNSVVRLKRGMHLSAGGCGYRLVFKPDVDGEFLNPRYQKDNWLYMLKAIST